MKAFVFYPEGYDVRSVFVNIDNAEFIPIDRKGILLKDADLKAGNTLYIDGKKTFKDKTPPIVKWACHF